MRGQSFASPRSGRGAGSCLFEGSGFALRGLYLCLRLRGEGGISDAFASPGGEAAFRFLLNTLFASGFAAGGCRWHAGGCGQSREWTGKYVKNPGLGFQFCDSPKNPSSAWCLRLGIWMSIDGLKAFGEMHGGTHCW